MPSWALRGPISLETGAIPTADAAGVEVLVVPHPDQYSRHALLHPTTVSALGIAAGSPAFITLADGSDCVVAVTPIDAVPPAALALSPAQQHNLHVKEGISTIISRFVSPPDRFSLVDVELEASLLGGAGGDGGADEPVLDASWAVQQFLKAYLGLIVAVNEACLFPAPPGVAAAAVVLRVRSCNTLEEEDAAQTVGYHCFRGAVTPATTVYLTGWASLRVAGALPRPPPGTSPHLISLLTNDGECFPVHRSLLRPCIALTQAVRTPGAGVEAAVDVDTSTFDRVLIFLEALHEGKEPPPFGVHHVPDLQRSAGSLGLGSLAAWAAARLGDATARRRWHSFDEIRRRNAAGECLLTMDGMVFDVTGWLAEHPGGAKIIPAQALNVDSSRFFELYHASRESFIYLREFYRGEVLPGDRAAVPRPSHELPSDDFLRQLREWTADFRLEEGGGGGDRTLKSF